MNNYRARTQSTLAWCVFDHTFSSTTTTKKKIQFVFLSLSTQDGLFQKWKNNDRIHPMSLPLSSSLPEINVTGGIETLSQSPLNYWLFWSVFSLRVIVKTVFCSLITRSSCHEGCGLWTWWRSSGLSWQHRDSQSANRRHFIHQHCFMYRLWK